MRVRTVSQGGTRCCEMLLVWGGYWRLMRLRGMMRCLCIRSLLMRSRCRQESYHRESTFRRSTSARSTRSRLTFPVSQTPWSFPTQFATQKSCQTQSPPPPSRWSSPKAKNKAPLQTWVKTFCPKSNFPTSPKPTLSSTEDKDSAKNPASPTSCKFK